MSRTIDERVVEMQFQNESFERNANQSISTLGKLDSALELKNGKKSFADVEAAAKKTNFSSLMNAVEQVSSKFTALGVIGFTALQRIANAAINVGTQLVKSLTIDPIMQGYQEYELKMGSIQTIMAGTGEDLQTVNGYLEELNEYADRTIYSFADMTQNIGKFTNNGVSLENSVAAIQGIANVAAISGANANEASRAMYNLAQALSAGYVKLIDWKSIENANMGTVAFKQNLIDMAVELGTVKKIGDGMYRTLTGKTFNATQNFNDVLQEQWMTSDVLINTLIRYTDETTELGQQAYEAATKVRTFSKLMDTLKEAVGSGWAMTAQYIIGDFEQASDLWTKVNDKLSGIINKSAEARNSLLKAWNQGALGEDSNTMGMWNSVDQVWTNMTGREAVLEGLASIFSEIEKILGRVSTAFGKVFDKLTANDLIQASYRFLNFARSLRLSDEQLNSLESGFTGIFSVIKKAGSMAKTFLGSLKPLVKLATYIGSILIDAFGKLGEKLSGISKWDSYKDFLSNFSDGLSKLVELLTNGADSAREFATELYSILKGNFETGLTTVVTKLGVIGETIQGIFAGLKIGDKLSSLFGTLSIVDGFSNSLSGFSLGNITSLIGTGGLTALLVSLTGLINTFKESLDSLSGVVGEGGVLGTLRDTLKSFQTQIKAKAIKDIAIAVGILAAALLVLSLIKPDRLMSAMTGLAMSMVGLVKVVSAVGKIVSGTGFNLKGFIALASGLISLAAAILILAAAVKIMAGLSWSELVAGLSGLAGVSYVLAKTAEYLTRNAKRLKVSAIGYIGLATAVLILSVAVKKFADLDFAKMLQGLIGVAAVLASIARFTKIAETAKVGVGTGVALITIAAAMIIFASAVAKFGEMPWQQALQGAIAMTVILAMIAGFSLLLSECDNMLSTGASLILASVAMQILASALEKFGSMDYEEFGRGLLAMCGSLMILAGAMWAFGKTKDGTTAMLAASAAMLILAPALKSLGQLSLAQVGISLLAIAAAFTILGVAGRLLKPLAPIILTLSEAITLMGVGVLAAGFGIIALAAGITALATAFSVGANAIVGGIVAMATGVAQGIVQFASIIADGAPTIAKAVVSVILSVLAIAATMIPKAVGLLMQFFSELLNTISAYIGPLSESIVNVIEQLGYAIANSADKIANAAVVLVIAFVNGIANGIRNNEEEIFAAVRNILSSIIELCISAIQMIFDLIPGAGFISDKLEDAKTAVREFLAPETMQDSGTDAGEVVGNNVTTGVTTAIDDSKDTLTTSGIDITGFIKEGAESVDTTSSGEEIVNGITRGIKTYSPKAIKAASELAKQCSDTIDKSLDINSPSKVTAKSGASIVEGLALGMKENTGDATNSAKLMASQTVNALNASLDGTEASAPAPVLDMSTIYSQIASMEQNEEWQMVIKPVLDMSEVNPGLSNLSAIVSAKAQNAASGYRNTQESAYGSGKTGAAASSQTNNISPNFYIYGAEGQNVEELADIIMSKMENAYTVKAEVFR